MRFSCCSITVALLHLVLEYILCCAIFLDSRLCNVYNPKPLREGRFKESVPYDVTYIDTVFMHTPADEPKTSNYILQDSQLLVLCVFLCLTCRILPLSDSLR